MYRLLIVDDMPDVVDILYDFFIFNTDLDVEKAYCGQEALDIAKKKKIDILISDINMPDINGLDLQNEITKTWSHCKAIFLTGYDDFGYAQQGLRQGAVDYITKTEENSRLMQAVEKAVELLNKEFRNNGLKNKIRDFSTIMPILQNNFLTDLLEGNIHPIFDVKARLEELQINLNSEHSVLLLKAYVTSQQQTNSEENIEILHGVRETVNEYITPVGTAVSVFIAKNEIVWIIQTSKDWANVIPYLCDAMSVMQNVCKDEFDILISFMLSNEPVQMKDVQEKYDIISAELDRAFNLETDILMICSDFIQDTTKHSNKHQEDRVRFALKKLKWLNLFLQNKQKNEYFALLESVLNVVSNSRSISYDILNETYSSIAVKLLTFINAMRLGQQIRSKIDLGKLTDFGHHAHWEAAVEFIMEISEIIFEQMDMKNEAHNKTLISGVNSYIETHLDEKLSTSEIAKALNYNRSYLSRRYKELTGNKLIEQIWNTRIAKAKEMLKQEEVKISDIYSELGFDSSQYFIRIFRKYTNLSPQEYRDNFLDGKEEN